MMYGAISISRIAVVRPWCLLRAGVTVAVCLGRVLQYRYERWLICRQLSSNIIVAV